MKLILKSNTARNNIAFCSSLSEISATWKDSFMISELNKGLNISDAVVGTQVFCLHFKSSPLL